MSSLVPDGWLLSSITEITSLKHGYQFRTPDFSDFGVKVVKIGQVVGSGKIDLRNCDFVRQEVYIQRKEFELKAGDILMSLTGNIGRVGVVPLLSQPLLQNYRVGLFKPVLSRCERDFLPHLLGSQFVTEQLLDKSNSTAQANFGKSDLDQVSVLRPPLPEQQKIAKILTSVDEVIEKTQAQIDKLKDLKTGMMQELLTNGIGHTEFKDSPVGRIPTEWEVGGIYDYCSEIFLGLTAKVDYTESEGVFLVRATDISKGRLSFDKARKITLEQHQSLTKKRQAKRGDVLISKSGSLGVCAIVETDIEFSIYESIIVLQPREGVIDSNYLLWLMRATETQTRLLGSTVGSTVGHLNLGDFRKLKIPIPTIIEQIKLGKMFNSLNEKHSKVESRLQKYKSIKKALLQDLLTGKVRVAIS
jgi:type I restriction enzyme S subunit